MANSGTLRKGSINNSDYVYAAESQLFGATSLLALYFQETCVEGTKAEPKQLPRSIFSSACRV